MHVFYELSLVVIFLVVAALMKTVIYKIVRRGMPDPYPNFAGGEDRLNRAVFLNALIHMLVWMPIILPVVLIDEATFESFTPKLPIYLLIFAYVFATDYCFQLLVELPILSIVKEYEDWKRKRDKVSASRMAGDRRYWRDRKKTARRLRLDHPTEQLESDLKDRRPPLSELR